MNDRGYTSTAVPAVPRRDTLRRPGATIEDKQNHIQAEAFLGSVLQVQGLGRAGGSAEGGACGFRRRCVELGLSGSQDEVF